MGEAERLAEVLHELGGWKTPLGSYEPTHRRDVERYAAGILASDWLAAHVAAARADALREAAAEFVADCDATCDHGCQEAARWLRARAAALLAETPGSDT